jgi:hypothetical protein
LTLWFKYGHDQEVTTAIMEGFRTVSVDTWLEVIPQVRLFFSWEQRPRVLTWSTLQLIARIHAPSANVRKLIQHVLTDVGKAHPQALVYPLTVASKYPSVPRRRAALSIMDKMRDHSASLVEQALLVSQELIRVAILWHELWHEGLEEASRLFYGDHNIDAMFATLEPLHDMLERVRGLFSLFTPPLTRLVVPRVRRRFERSPSRRRSVGIFRMRESRAEGIASTVRSTISTTLGIFTTRFADFELVLGGVFFFTSC